MSVEDVSSDFEWVSDYDALLDQISHTDVVDSEWSVLRDMIKYKIDYNVKQFLTDEENATDPQGSPSSPGTHSPPASPLIGASNSVSLGGLILPPFPPRSFVNNTACKTLPGQMSPEEADQFKRELFSTLGEFDRSPPFTIQRICQLCLSPRRHYRTVGKYLRALERTLLVTSSWDMFPPLPASEEEYSVNPASASSNSLRAATTPLFSPIPFLHDDARSRSPSPISVPHAASPPAPSEKPALGLVDELDDPKPGHLSDRPKPLTAVTSKLGRTVAVISSLSERFVSAQELEAAGQPSPARQDATPPTSKEEDKEVEAMVLDKSA